LLGKFNAKLTGKKLWAILERSEMPEVFLSLLSALLAIFML
jgi:hypothetical protein